MSQLKHKITFDNPKNNELLESLLEIDFESLNVVEIISNLYNNYDIIEFHKQIRNITFAIELLNSEELGYKTFKFTRATVTNIKPIINNSQHIVKIRYYVG